jgi:hypothetical protein
MMTSKDTVKILGLNTKVCFILETQIVRIPLQIAGYRELREDKLCIDLYFWPHLQRLASPLKLRCSAKILSLVWGQMNPPVGTLGSTIPTP